MEILSVEIGSLHIPNLGYESILSRLEIQTAESEDLQAVSAVAKHRHGGLVAHECSLTVWSIDAIETSSRHALLPQFMLVFN